MVKKPVSQSLWVALFILLATLPAMASFTHSFSPVDSTHLVRAGEDLQSVLNQASPGDTILLEAGATFSGNFILPKVESNNRSVITIRTSAPDEQLPPAGSRIDPTFSNKLAKLVSPNSEAALRTVNDTHHFRFIGIEFTIAPDVMLNYGIVKFGGGDETTIDALPHHLTLDRCYIHGNALADVARGVALNSATTTIINSYISDCHGIGFDTQAIASWNGTGPFTIINNYLEGAGENVLFGGADPKIVNLVPSDIEFRRNHLAKPLHWKAGILAKPVHLTAQSLPSSGALNGYTTYYYRVTARTRAGYSATATSAASDEISVTPQTGDNLIQLSWQPVERATAYRIYRTTDDPTVTERNWVYFEMDALTCSTTDGICPFIDTGTIEGTRATPPTQATRWSVKNIFELKNARRVLIEGNLFENNWVDAQSGVAILFTVRNQDGTAPWSIVEDVTFTSNIVRHTAGAINILGQDYLKPSEKARNIKIVNNLFEDINGKQWGGGNGVFLIITDVVSITVMHNTVLQSGNTINAYGQPSDGVKFLNNIFQHNEYGIIGDGTGTGKSTLNKYLPGKKFKGNAFIGGNSSLYPELNFFFQTMDEIGFVDAANGNYELVPLSPLKGRGTDGKDVGCDMNQLKAALQVNQ
ncbi:MAG: hypothetical protein AB1757_10730 [Acidobacteriota bacterium]